MHAYTKLVKKFLNGYMAETREQRGMSKEEMSERLRIEPRSYADLEKEMLERINGLGIGPGGLGGRITAFAVNIETYPTHIAGLPVAVNICCHVNRHAHRVI